jgi:hypothetical protein
VLSKQIAGEREREINQNERESVCLMCLLCLMCVCVCLVCK